MVSSLTILFLGKPPAGSLPVISAHSFASNLQLALLELAEEGNIFHRRMCPMGCQSWGCFLQRVNTTNWGQGYPTFFML